MIKLEPSPRDLEMMVPEQNIPFLAELMVFYSKKIKPDVLNLSRYAAREGTIAAKMKQLPTNTLKHRSRAMTDLYRKIALENNKKWIGWKGRALIDEKGKNDSWIGRNYCYKPVIVKGNFNLGDEIDVKITDATSFDLRGEWA